MRRFFPADREGMGKNYDKEGKIPLWKWVKGRKKYIQTL